MPLIHSKSKKAFEKNVKTEMEAHPDKRKQDLAIAYSVQRHAKKAQGGEIEMKCSHGNDKGSCPMCMGGKAPGGARMAEGGEVNESLHPEHSNPTAKKTMDIDHLRLGHMAQDHEDMKEPSEPKDEVYPAEENMGRTDADISRIRRAVNMAMGGRLDEHEGMDKSPEAGRRLAMNDTYPPGPAESDTQAQDEGFGDGKMRNEMMSEDESGARSRNKMSSSNNMALGGGVPDAEPRDLNEQPREGQSVDEDYNMMGKTRMSRALESVRRRHMGK